MNYTIVVEYGKPYEISAVDEEDLKKTLKSLYLQSLEPNYEDLDFKVYNENDEDISDSELISSMVKQIMEAEQ